MTWKQYLGILAGMLVVSLLWSLGGIKPEVVTAVLVGVLLVGELIRRLIRKRRFERIRRLPEAESAMEVMELPPEEAALIRLALNAPMPEEQANALPDSVSFPYRKDSPSLNLFIFWSSALLAVAMLVPIALGRFKDSADMWVWIILALVLGFSAYWYHDAARSIGRTLTIDRTGITLKGADGSQHLSWLEISWVRALSLPGGIYHGIELHSRSGKTILIDTEVPRFWEIVEIVVHRLQSIRG